MAQFDPQVVDVLDFLQKSFFATHLPWRAVPGEVTEKREWLIVWAKHKGAKSRSHQESFETLCPGGFVVNKSPFF